MRALYTASTGMLAQELNVEVLSNNIANMRTPGYKQMRVDFQDLLYHNQRRSGTQSSETGTIYPVGVQVGAGVQVAATPRIMTQGSLESTDKQLDVAIRGEGFFNVQLPDGTTAYTRDGSFNLSADGTIVTIDGYTVSPGISIPSDATDITINENGEVQAIIQGQSPATVVGTLDISRFVNKEGLEAIGDNLMIETAASGAPQSGTAGSDGYGAVLQGYLEISNVVAVREISSLISAQRAYEMNSRVIAAADEMLAATSNLR